MRFLLLDDAPSLRSASLTSFSGTIGLVGEQRGFLTPWLAGVDTYFPIAAIQPAAVARRIHNYFVVRTPSSFLLELYANVYLNPNEGVAHRASQPAIKRPSGYSAAYSAEIHFKTTLAQ